MISSTVLNFDTSTNTNFDLTTDSNIKGGGNEDILFISILIFIVIVVIVVIIIVTNNSTSSSDFNYVYQNKKEIPPNINYKIKNLSSTNSIDQTLTVDKDKLIKEFNERCAKYIGDNKKGKSTYTLPLILKAKEQLPFDLVDKLFNEYTNWGTKIKSSEDFTMILMIRVLYLLPENSPERKNFQDRLTTVWKDTDFWIKPNETKQCFWSENHMICYLSTAFLWSQVGGTVQPVDKVTIENILRKYLTVKIKYGYYEAFSQVYNMYTFSAILNIYDFTPENSEWRLLAKQCMDKLVREFLSITNSTGGVYCSAGRTYNSFKTDNSNLNFNKFLYLYTNLNKESGLSAVGSFIASSPYFPDIEIFSQNYTSNYENVITLSHSPTDFNFIYKELSTRDRTMFQWSAGCYFGKYQVADTIKMLTDYNLWNHSHFSLDNYSTIIKLFPKSLLASGSEQIDAFTTGSMLCDMKYHIYHHDDVILTSFEKYNYGKLGAQQFPWVANVGNIPIFTQAGKIIQVGNLNEAVGNSSLPWVVQSGPMALIAYQPDSIIKTMAEQANLDLRIYLQWPITLFDEQVVFDNWHFGRKGNNYIGVLSSNKLVVRNNGQEIFNNNTDRCGWVVIVGTSTQYADFNEFQQVLIYGVFASFKFVDKKSNSFFSNEKEYQCKATFGPYSAIINW
jgi:hypothetical protein